MIFDIRDTIIDVGLSIGGFIFLSLILITLSMNIPNNVVRNKFKSKKLQVLLGAFLGFTPGCGGAIVVSNLYIKKKISFGALIATFITTMGEGAFIILVGANGLKDWLIVSLVSFVIAIVVGYIIDIIKLEINFKEKQPLPSEKQRMKSSKIHDFVQKYVIESYGFYTFVLFGAILSVFSVVLAFEVQLNSFFEVIGLYVSGIFMLVSFIYYILDKLVHKVHYCTHDNNLYSGVLHSLKDVALLMVYISIGVLLTDAFIGDGPSFINDDLGAFVILGAVVLGAIPGCTTFVLLAVLYQEKVIPFSALLAGSIATNGDAAFPILAVNRKLLLYITLFTSLIALVVGLFAYSLGY